MNTKKDNVETSVKGVSAPILYTLLKEANASKLSLKKPGVLTYQIGMHPDTKTLAIRITSNDSGGYFSKEWIDATLLENILKSPEKEKPFKSGLFKNLFKGSSSNNAGFCAAVCRKEGLIKPSAGNAFMHLIDQPYAEWVKSVNKLKGIGTAENLSPPKEKSKKVSEESSDTSTKTQGTLAKNTSLFDQPSDEA